MKIKKPSNIINFLVFFHIFYRYIILLNESEIFYEKNIQKIITYLPNIFSYNYYYSCTQISTIFNNFSSTPSK